MEVLMNAIPGTVPQWGTFATVLLILAGIVAAWVKGMPDRKRADNEEKKISGDQYSEQMEQYAEQIKEFREEVHGYRNELQIVRREAADAERESSRRGDHITNLTFIVRLLMSELERIAPDSIILKQAEALMLQLTVAEKPASPARAARDTVRAAQRTVDQIEGNRE
jgi:hypothetical protein